MADNLTITAGSGTTIAADDIGGVLSQRVKVQWGPDGTVNDADVATGKPLPVQLRSATGTAADLSVLAAVTATANALDINIKSGANANGRAVPGSSAPVVLASQTYETVAASQTAQVMGGSGATGDFIAGVLVIPATTSPGNVLLLDNATSITIFAGGTGSVSNLVPFFIPLDMISASGAWKITTGANVSCIGIGNFS